MASAPAPDPAASQQPQQQDPSKPQAPLDNLQAMLNLVLVQGGRFIKEHQSGGGTGRMKFSLQRAVPAAAERFHDSLDELENELHLAQTVLRRDLALLKADRKKREAAAKQQEAERARLAAETSAKQNAPPKKDETPVQKEPVPAEPETANANASNQPPQAEDQPSLNREEEHAPAPASNNEPPAADPLFDGTPPAANPQDTEFDFDAMFGEGMDSMDNDQGDINMDGGDLNFNLDDDSSLIPGLDDFGKTNDNNTAGGQSTDIDLDFTMGDLPEVNTVTATNPTPAEPPQPPPVSKPAEPPAATQPTTTTAPAPAPAPAKDDEPTSPLGDVMADDLNDLFNIDEYENPETSQFDDAFFDFGS